jgi:hypothetical protein
VDFQLRPVRTWSVAGRLDGPPEVIAGLPLRLVPVGCEDLGMGGEAATTLAASDGRFTFPNVPAGRYSLDARTSLMEYVYRPQGTALTSDSLPRTPGFTSNRGGGGTIMAAPPGTSYSYSASDRDATAWGRADVEVAGRDLTDVVVTMRRAVRLSGRIQIDRGTTVDQQPDPRTVMPAVAGRPGVTPPTAIVMAEPANGSASLGLLSGQVAPDNSFTVDGLLPGAYVLRVLLIGGGGGARPLSLRSVVWRGEDHTYVPFDASAGANISDVVVTFVETTQKITGSVSNMPPGGGGTTVIAFPVDRARWTNYGFQPSLLRSTTAGGDGRFELTLPGGDFYLVALGADRADGWQDPAFLDIAARSATRVSLEWGETTSQTLPFSEVNR